MSRSRSQHICRSRIENKAKKIILKIKEYTYIVDAATSSGILKAKQKLGRTSDKLGGIAFTKISKLTMCSA